jgi:FtsZ-interacting cell division protein ZipA
MDTTTLIIIAAITAIVVFIVGGLLGVYFSRRQRTKRLQEKFGPEYDRMLSETEDQSEVEDELEARMERVESLEIQPLSEEQKERFAQQWQSTQAKFVDQPLAAIREADQLIKAIMYEKGYPVEDFERRAADISVDYPKLVVNYRNMRNIVNKSDHEDISTEEMRQAMVHSRSLFEELLGVDVTEYTNQKEKV